MRLFYQARNALERWSEKSQQGCMSFCCFFKRTKVAFNQQANIVAVALPPRRTCFYKARRTKKTAGVGWIKVWVHQRAKVQRETYKAVRRSHSNKGWRLNRTRRRLTPLRPTPRASRGGWGVNGSLHTGRASRGRCGGGGRHAIKFTLHNCATHFCF